MSPPPRELRIPPGSSKATLEIGNEYPGKYDVSSIKIPAANVAECLISVGGHAILTLDNRTLKALPEEDGHVEVLRPFLPRLPLTHVKYNEFRIALESPQGTVLPEGAIKLEQQHGLSVESILPVLQPQTTFRQDICLRTDGGIIVAPNALHIDHGVATMVLRYVN